MAILLTIVGLGLSNFSGKPIASEMEVGARLAKKGKGIDRVLGLNRVVFRSWFDGERMVDVEHAVIMTPGLLSRWLGHQQACGEKEIQPAWDRFASQSHGRTLVFFRLATLNTLDLTDGDESDTGQPSLFDEVEIGFGQTTNRKAGPARFAPLVLKSIQDIQDRHPRDVLKTSWDQVVSRVVAWPTLPLPDLDSPIRWGRNRVVGFLAELPTITDTHYGAFQIRYAGRNRVVRFELPKS
ncbi:MAG: hypothetical protein WCK51_15570 [Armatimonadota bacterium]